MCRKTDYLSFDRFTDLLSQCWIQGSGGGGGGGAKGAHAPPPKPTVGHTSPPESFKKKLMIELMSPKSSTQKIGTSASCSF